MKEMKRMKRMKRMNNLYFKRKDAKAQSRNDKLKLSGFVS